MGNRPPAIYTGYSEHRRMVSPSATAAVRTPLVGALTCACGAEARDHPHDLGIAHRESARNRPGAGTVAEDVMQPSWP